MRLLFESSLTDAVPRLEADKLGDLASALDFGAVGDGVADDTAALQAALDACAGRALFLPGGCIFLISAPLTLPSHIRLCGSGKLQSAAHSGAVQYLLNATGKTDIVIEDIEIDGQALNTATPPVLTPMRGGISLSSCTDVTVRGTRIRNTLYAGVKLVNVLGGRVADNDLFATGQPSVSPPNYEDHGILIAAQEEGVTRNILVSGNRIDGDGKTRKGITTYASPRKGPEVSPPYSYYPSRVEAVTIIDNAVQGCDLGSIYIANDPTNYYGTDPAARLLQEGIVVADNVCRSAYGDIQINTVRGASVTGNVSLDADIYGLHATLVQSCRFAGNQIIRAGKHGIFLGSSDAVVIEGNAVMEAAALSAGAFSCGILLDAVTGSKIARNIVTDNAARMQYGYFEQNGSANNVLSDNDIRNATVTRYTLASTSYRRDVVVATATYNPPSIAAGGRATTTVSVSGAAFGDSVIAAFNVAMQGLVLTGSVGAAGSVDLAFENPGASAVDLASGQLTVWVYKAR